MAISSNATAITFNDATTQTTAPVNTNANVTSATAVAGTGISVSSITTTGAATHTITNTGVTSVTAGTGISVSASTGGVTITNTSSASGTVTSVATGNGLSGGTITSTGTLTLACPSANSVGAYAPIFTSNYNVTRSYTQGSTFSVGAAQSCTTLGVFDSAYDNGGSASGTWRVMSAGAGVNSGSLGSFTVLCCRVS